MAFLHSWSPLHQGASVCQLLGKASAVSLARYCMRCRHAGAAQKRDLLQLLACS